MRFRLAVGTVVDLDPVKGPGRDKNTQKGANTNGWFEVADRAQTEGGESLPGAEILEVADTSEVTAVAETPATADALDVAGLDPTLAVEIYKLHEDGRRLQIRASHLARDGRPEFEAWFEAGLLLRRASERMVEIAVRRGAGDEP